MSEYIPVVKLQDASSSKSTTVKHSYLYELRKVQEAIEIRACQEIRFAQPLLTLHNTGIIYPSTITVIQGQKGVHKSRLTENFCAAFIRGRPADTFIGFQVTPLKRFHVVYIDTERNQNDQFPYAVQRIKERAGFLKTDRPPNFEAVSLISIERDERFEAVREYLENVRLKHPDEIIIVVLDVITDCTGSFNDPKESMKLLDHLNMTINHHNMAFICVIHENPNSSGDSKARGHLGTEIVNKATTVISIGYEKGANGVATDLIALKFMHTRNTKRPEPHYLRYSEQVKGLEVADAAFVSDQKSKKAEKATLPELKDWLTENLDVEIAKTDLVNKLTGYFGCSGKTVETRLKSLVDEGLLGTEKRRKEVYYTLPGSLSQNVGNQKDPIYGVSPF